MVTAGALRSLLLLFLMVTFRPGLDAAPRDRLGSLMSTDEELAGLEEKLKFNT
jgi:hypothetical protein